MNLYDRIIHLRESIQLRIFGTKPIWQYTLEKLHADEKLSVYLPLSKKMNLLFMEEYDAQDFLLRIQLLQRRFESRITEL